VPKCKKKTFKKKKKPGKKKKTGKGKGGGLWALIGEQGPARVRECNFGKKGLSSQVGGKHGECKRRGEKQKTEEENPCLGETVL